MNPETGRFNPSIVLLWQGVGCTSSFQSLFLLQKYQHLLCFFPPLNAMSHLFPICTVLQLALLLLRFSHWATKAEKPQCKFCFWLSCQPLQRFYLFYLLIILSVVARYSIKLPPPQLKGKFIFFLPPPMHLNNISAAGKSDQLGFKFSIFWGQKLEALPILSWLKFLGRTPLRLD